MRTLITFIFIFQLFAMNEAQARQPIRNFLRFITGRGRAPVVRNYGPSNCGSGNSCSQARGPSQCGPNGCQEMPGEQQIQAGENEGESQPGDMPIPDAGPVPPNPYTKSAPAPLAPAAESQYAQQTQELVSPQAANQPAPQARVATPNFSQVVRQEPTGGHSTALQSAVEAPGRPIAAPVAPATANVDDPDADLPGIAQAVTAQPKPQNLVTKIAQAFHAVSPENSGLNLLTALKLNPTGLSRVPFQTQCVSEPSEKVEYSGTLILAKGLQKADAPIGVTFLNTQTPTQTQIINANPAQSAVVRVGASNGLEYAGTHRAQTKDYALRMDNSGRLLMKVSLRAPASGEFYCVGNYMAPEQVPAGQPIAQEPPPVEPQIDQPQPPPPPKTTQVQPPVSSGSRVRVTVHYMPPPRKCGPCEQLKPTISGWKRGKYAGMIREVLGGSPTSSYPATVIDIVDGNGNRIGNPYAPITGFAPDQIASTISQAQAKLRAVASR